MANNDLNAEEGLANVNREELDGIIEQLWDNYDMHMEALVGIIEEDGDEVRRREDIDQLIARLQEDFVRLDELEELIANRPQEPDDDELDINPEPLRYLMEGAYKLLRQVADRSQRLEEPPKKYVARPVRLSRYLDPLPEYIQRDKEFMKAMDAAEGRLTRSALKRQLEEEEKNVEVKKAKTEAVEEKEQESNSEAQVSPEED